MIILCSKILDQIIPSGQESGLIRTVRKEKEVVLLDCDKKSKKISHSCKEGVRYHQLTMTSSSIIAP